ncbi:MAG: Gfo/Idh/MocA family oxidoreductase [Clostridia bacterium]|nr:Gfo/Idh/MocA family oxidoreductase [Clostridia bacterium]
MATQKKVRLGLVGTGSRCHSLCDAYHHHKQLEIVACCDTAKGKAEAFAGIFEKITGQKGLRAYSSYEEMLQNEALDALMICCDPDVQVDIACDAMNRGIHVMTEVPAAFSIAQCENLVDTVEKTGCKYQLAEQTRYWKFIQEWRAMAERGEFGHIIYAEGEYLHYEPAWDNFLDRKTGYTTVSADPSFYADPAYRSSWRNWCFRNPIFYLPHTLSPLLSITGGRITKVCCMGTRPLSYATELMSARDIQNAVMYNDQDTVFSVRTGYTSPYGFKAQTGAHWYQIKGTERTVEWARSTIDTPKMFTPVKGTHDGEWKAMDWTCADPDMPDEFKEAAHGGTDFYPIHYFVDAILNDKTPPMDVYKAVETAAPAILAAISCEKGGVMLEVPDFRHRK